MFSIIADLLTIITAVLFPIFASYKALRTSDPAQLAPWLMYWIVVSIFTSVDSFFSFILDWVPFYSWARLGIHIYLLMPGQYGAVALYQKFVHPFLFQHEKEIEDFISNSHERAKRAGLQYVKMAVDYVRVNVLGQQPRPPPPPTRGASYAQQLLSRFNLPSAGQGLAAPAGDIYGLLTSALQSVTSSTTSREAQVDSLSASGSLIPSTISTPEERMSYISRQRDGLRVLLQAFDREALTEQERPDDVRRRDDRHREDRHRDDRHRDDRHRDDRLRDDRPRGERRREDGDRDDRNHRSSRHSQHRTSPQLSKSRSEVDFERIEPDEVSDSGRPDRSSQGSWMPWNWNGQQPPDDGSGVGARSSGVDYRE